MTATQKCLSADHLFFQRIEQYLPSNHSMFQSDNYLCQINNSSIHSVYHLSSTYLFWMKECSNISLFVGIHSSASSKQPWFRSISNINEHLYRSHNARHEEVEKLLRDSKQYVHRTTSYRWKRFYLKCTINESNNNQCYFGN